MRTNVEVQNFKCLVGQILMSEINVQINYQFEYKKVNAIIKICSIPIKSWWLKLAILTSKF